MARAPGITNEYPQSPSNGPVVPVNAAVVGLMVDTEWGPVNTPTRVTSLNDAIIKFGEHSLTSDAIYAIDQCLKGGAELYVSRLGAYSDISDVGTLGGVRASYDLGDLDGATTLAVSAKHVGEYGNSLYLKVTRNPKFSSRLAVDALQGADTIRTSNLSGVYDNQVIKIETLGTPNNLASAIAALNELKAVFNAHLATEGDVHLSGDVTNVVAEADATSQTTANTLLNAIAAGFSGHFADETSHANADDTGYGVPASASSRTRAQLIDDTITLINILDAHIATVEDSLGDPVHAEADIVNVPNKVQYLEVVSSEGISGVGSYNVIELSDTLLYDLGASALISSMEFNLQVYRGQNLLEEFNGLTMVNGLDNTVTTVINSEAGGSNYITVEDALSPSGIGLSFPDDTPYALLADGESMSADITFLDIVGSELSLTGVHAFDSFPQVGIISVIPSDNVRPYNSAVLVPLQSWCEARKDTILYAEMDPILDFDDTYDAILESGLNSRFSAVYGPRVKVTEVHPDATSASRFISPLGSVAGLRARVDATSGVHEASAGSAPFGNIDVQGVEKAYTQTQRGLLNDRGYNVILKKPEGVLVYGSRTCSQDLLWRMQPVSRYFMYAQRTLDGFLPNTLFRVNDRSTWLSTKLRIEDFLRSEWQRNALYGATASEAFRVLVGADDGVQTELDRLQGNLILEISLRPSRQAEFITVRWFQTDASVNVVVG